MGSRLQALVLSTTFSIQTMLILSWLTTVVLQHRTSCRMGTFSSTLSKPVQPSSLAAYPSHLLSCTAAHPWMQNCTSLLVSQTRTLAAAYLICSEVTQCQIPLGSICMMLTSKQQITELEPIQRASCNCTAGKLLVKDYLIKISILSGNFLWNMERVTPGRSPKGMQEGK